ncbi:MAG: ROK family protein [Sedimentitalea sp.]
MTRLVADIGGTNTRLALVDDTGALHAQMRLANDDFDGIKAVLQHFTAHHPARINAACLAIAGPVAGTRAQLTNRGWSFDRASLSEQLGGAKLRFVNDLAALGYALPSLNAAQVQAFGARCDTDALNDQALVVGVGTGFNICLVKGDPVAPAVIEAELGHASLPACVADALGDIIGARTRAFPTIEDLFSGRGLTRLDAMVTGEQGRDGADMLRAYGEGAPVAAVDHVAQLLGLMARQLVFAYRPARGIFFAGSVARGVLGSQAQSAFLRAFATPGAFADLIAATPLNVITDDAAALTGAARVVAAMMKA